MNAARRALVITALGLALAGVAGSPVGADGSDGPCTGNAGVTVVVDFQELGGGVNVRCAPGTPTTGFEALQMAGVSYQTTVRFPGFVCKIAGRPESDPCQTASPASAYWSYWVAPTGGTWCYSNFGAGNRTPPPGTFEGWSFSKDKTTAATPPPHYAPPPLPEGTVANPIPGKDCTTPTAANTTTTTTATATASTTATTRPAGAVTTAAAPVPTTTTTAAADSAAPDPSSTSTVAASPTGPAQPSSLGTVDLSDDGQGDGSPLAAIGGIGLVAIIGSVAAVTTVRRRRAGADDLPIEPPADPSP